jgi:hypothetical protein
VGHHRRVDQLEAHALARRESRENRCLAELARQRAFRQERESRSRLSGSHYLLGPERERRTFRALAKNDFNGDAIVELTGLVAFQNMSSKFNSADA